MDTDNPKVLFCGYQQHYLDEDDASKLLNLMCAGDQMKEAANTI